MKSRTKKGGRNTLQQRLQNAKMEKRHSLLYVRIKKSNREFLDKTSKKQGITVTEYVDTLFDVARGA